MQESLARSLTEKAIEYGTTHEFIGRLQAHGYLESLSSLILSVKESEESVLQKTLKKKVSFEKASAALKGKFTLVVQLLMAKKIVDELWQKPASSPAATAKLPLVPTPTRQIEMKRDHSVESDQCRPYSLSPENRERTVSAENNKEPTQATGQFPDLKNVALEPRSNEVEEERVTEGEKFEVYHDLPKEESIEQNENIKEDEDYSQNEQFAPVIKEEMAKKTEKLQKAKTNRPKPVKMERITVDYLEESSWELQQRKPTPKLHSGSSSTRINYKTHAHDAVRLSSSKSKQSAATLPNNSPSLRKKNSLSNKSEIFRTARDKTEFFNSLVHSEFSVIHTPGTFNKQKRVTMKQTTTQTPGPAFYYPRTGNNSPGGYLPRSKRQYLVNEREASKSPGPHDYVPKYHYIAKATK